LKLIRDQFDVRVFGLDISRRNIENLTLMGLEGAICDFSESDTDFHREAFDVAISLETIEHLADTRHFLKLIYDTLKPNGIVLITTPNSFNLRRRLDFVVGRHSDPLMDPSRVEFAAHIRGFSFEMIECCIAQAGFENCLLVGDRVPFVGGSKISRILLSFLSSHIVAIANKPA